MTPATAIPASQTPPPFRMSRVAGHTFVYMAGTLLRSAVGFIMLPVYTRYLTPADYGVLELIEMTLNVVAIVAGSRLALGVFRFYHKAETDREKRLVVSTAMLMLGATYTACAIGIFAASSPLAALVLRGRVDASLIVIGGATFVFNSLVIVPTAYLRVRERSRLYVLVNAGKLVAQLSLNILFVVGFRLGVRGILLSDLISSVIVGTALGVMTFREVGFGFSTRLARDFVRYGAPLMLTQAATFISTFGDRYFLRALTDLTTVGLYSLSYQFGFLLGALGATPFGLIWEPARFEIAKRPDRDEVLSRGFVLLNLLLVTMAVGITLFVGDALNIMAAPAFRSAGRIVPVILVAYVLQAWTGVQDIGILVTERTKYIASANWVSTAVVLLAYTLLIPPLKGLGAALATLLAFGTRYALIFYRSQRLWPVRYRWTPVWWLLAIGSAVSIVGTVLPGMGLPASVATHTILLLLYAAAVWYLPILSDSERVAVVGAIRSPRTVLASRGR